MLAAGQRIDRYVVDRLIGRGGFAQVWAVEHAVLGSRRAIKVLSTDKVFLQESLVEEGRVQARLVHPNILPVLDVFVYHDAPVLVMPLVEDCTLERVLDRGAVDPETAAALMRGVVSAVAFAHSQGVAHRDLKPANVLLELQNGAVVPRVADFGLAMLITGPAVLTTGPGPFVGTPVYAAPEQLRNAGGVDHKADYWSLGVMLYELLTGWRPYDFSTLSKLRRQQQDRAHPDLLARGPELDPAWKALVDSLLEPDPQVRLADPERLQEWLDDICPRSSPSPLGADGRLANTLWMERSGQTQATAPTEDLSDVELASLPAPRDAFIGREAESRELRNLLDLPGLVTITGPAGVGKSRLALEAAREHLRTQPGEARRADLAEARDLDGALVAIAAALDVPVLMDDPAAHLGWVLGARSPILLLLDNVDQVIGPVTQLLARWDEEDLELRALVTAQGPLHAPGERVVRLDVMPPPADDELGTVESNDAVRLFLARIREHRPGVALNARTAAGLARLVRRLDGLPLALELAAARPTDTESVGPVDLSGMLRRLESELDVLGGPTTQGDERTALRTALDRSWAQLSHDERHLLVCMSTFEGGATLPAIRSVAGDTDARATEDRLAVLVDRSLVRRIQVGSGPPRFGLLRSVHAYGRDRLGDLPPAVVTTIERGHAAWFARFGRPHELSALRVRGGSARRVELRAELDNLLVALRRATAWRDTDLVSSLALAAWAVTEHTGPYPTAVRWLRSARRAGIGPRDADLCLAEGDALRLSGRRDASNPSYEAGLRTARAADDPWATAMCLDRLGRNRMAQGHLDDADPLLAEALAQIQRSGDGSRIAEVADDIGWLRLQQKRPAEAEQAFNAALSAFERLGDRASVAVCTQHLALAVDAQGDHDRADELLQVALAMHRTTGNRRMEAFCLSDLGAIAAREARWADASALQEQAIALHREVGDRHGQALALFRLGEAQHAGRDPAARTSLEAAWELANSAGDGPLEAAIEAALGGL